MVPRNLEPSMCYGEHTLAQDCTILVEGHRAGFSWEESPTAESVTLTAGTVMHIQGGSQGRMQVLLNRNGTGYIVAKDQIAQIVVK
ncbi:MAG: hypothetical protein PHI23_03935 [Candidatus Peribacteraceae bacterium]|nr:hypothetical protein [Candidatus Peribacteraceae bacterium]